MSEGHELQVGVQLIGVMLSLSSIRGSGVFVAPWFFNLRFRVLVDESGHAGKAGPGVETHP